MSDKSCRRAIHTSVYVITPISAHAHNPEKHDRRRESGADRRLYKPCGFVDGANAGGTVKRDPATSNVSLIANIADA